MEIGFIGLDNIGFPMAKRLASKFSVVAFDVRPESVSMFAEMGGKTAPSVLEIGKRCETIFSSVPSSEMLEAVTIGNDGIVTSKNHTICQSDDNRIQTYQALGRSFVKSKHNLYR